MKMHSCDRLWEIDALLEGRLGAADAEACERHRRSCTACSEKLTADQRILALAAQLPAAAVDEVSAKRLRARILRDAAGTAVASRSVSRVTMIAAAIAALAVAVLLTSGVRRAMDRGEALAVAATWDLVGSPTGRVTPDAGAVFVQTRFGALETVRLLEGTVALSVPHREARERFVVRVPDGEIEVRGTTFRVSVTDGRTTEVRVTEGVVAVRVGGRDEVILRTGDAWPSVEPLAAAPAIATKTKTTTTSALPSDASPYADAIALYRGHRYDEAARAFHAFAASHSGAGEAEDAAFLEAVCLARAGRADAAGVVAERFLERYPSSFHARDAAMLVSRAARDRGDCEKARRAAARWTTPKPSAEWSAALGSCLPPG
jgi:ferric-dicitrate binding protein FerR (iron transport regulator)